MYARSLTEEAIKDRIVEQVDTERFQRITASALEGLATRELNLAALIGRRTEAKERRLVPEVIEDFFVHAAPLAAINPKEARGKEHIYHIGRIPRTLWQIGERLEHRFGRLGHEYKQIVFDKEYLKGNPTFEWVTPGHPLFECVREEVLQRVQNDLRRGTVFYDLHRKEPARLDVLSAAIQDGRGKVLHRRLFVVETAMDGTMTVRQPTIFLDMVPASGNIDTHIPDDTGLPDRDRIEHTLINDALQPLLEEVTTEREKEIETISCHIEISLSAIIDRVQCQFAELVSAKESGSTEPGLDGRIKQFEDRLFELNGRLEQRQEELQHERHCTIADIRHHGSAWVLPHPERTSPEIASMVRNDEIEKTAVQAVVAYEEARGWEVESVEADNRGFDLISRKPHPEDPQTAIIVRFIEVKGRATVGEVALTANEYKTAERLKDDYWLYVVFNCSTEPEVHTVQDPARLGWEPLVTIEHYHVGAEEILGAEKAKTVTVEKNPSADKLKLTPKQQKYMNQQGHVTVRRDGKFVTIERHNAGEAEK
jgi:hypothetical protein